MTQAEQPSASVGSIKRRASVGFAALLSTGAALAQDDLFELSLSQLLSLEVTSVTKRAQSVSEAAAAVFVITADDIRRSGVTSIPEALRMAPGLEVAQVDGNKWAISARGSQGRFANKLLVLMDGRTLYSQVFSGVWWDVQDTLLEDVERIEIIRGPGATVWGANAVNGVINIITRSTNDTHGTLVSGGFGDQERLNGAVRVGGGIGDVGHYRVFAKYFDRDGNRIAGTSTDAGDDWWQQRIGFRADFTLGDYDLVFHGDAYRGKSGTQTQEPLLTPPYAQSRQFDADVSGFNLFSRFDTTLENGDQLGLQAFYNVERRDWELADFDVMTVEVDATYRNTRFEAHDLQLGATYRFIEDTTQGSQRVGVDPESREEEVFSAFVQDEWTLIPDQLSLTGGLKVELNDFTGYEVQPNLRFSWRPTGKQTLWGSIARAVRTPSRAERDSFVLGAVIPPATAFMPPTAVLTLGNRDFEAETLVAYEAGFKFDVSDTLAWDVALFYNDYDRLRANDNIGFGCFPLGEFPACTVDPSTQALAVLTQQTNAAELEAYGLEWAGSWQVSPNWQLKGAYTYIDEQPSADPSTLLVELPSYDPRHIASLRSSHRLSEKWDADVWLRYADSATTAFGPIDAYTTFDLRLARRFGKSSEVALIGRNLVDDDRVEFISELGDVRATEMQRSVHLQLRLEF